MFVLCIRIFFICIYRYISYVFSFVVFQDWDLTWNTTAPIFTTCFLKVALIWGPVIFFWICAPIEVCFIIRSKEKKIPWSTLNVAKQVSLLYISRDFRLLEFVCMWLELWVFLKILKQEIF